MAGYPGIMSPEEVEAACVAGDVEQLYALLSQEQDLVGVVNVAYGDGVTLLMKTIIGAGSEGANPQGRYADCCTLLIQGGAQLDTADTTYGRTAAHWAVYYQREDILSVLIEAGGDMTCPDYEGTSPFHLCVQERATSCLLISLQLLPADILRMPHPQFLFPLHHAIARDDRETCEVLVSAGADVNEMDEESKRSALHIAAENNSRGLVDYLVACGAHLDVVDSRGLTPLHIACIVEGEDALEAIVKRVGGGEVLDIRDEAGLTPLMHACQYGNSASVKILVRKKADVSVLDVDGRCCLHYAAESSSQTAHECVQMLLRKHKNLLEVKDNEGRSVIHGCAASGTDQTLSVLIAAGCSMEIKDSNQRTPLHWAALNGNSVVMSQLLERGAEMGVVDSQGSTPLHMACQYSLMHLGEPFTEETAVRQELIQQCVELLLRAGAATEVVDAQGYMPLHYAVQTQTNLPVVALLLQYGADITARTSGQRMTALHVAARGSYTDSCKYLLEASGGELGNVEDANDQTALHAVVEGVALGGVVMEQVLECLEVLIQAGLQPDQPDNELRTPVHVAASYGLVDCVRLLAQYGANLSMPSVDGATPLHEAASGGQAAVVEFLVSSEGVAIDAGAGHAKATALHYAVQGGHLECVQILLQYGADVNSLTVTEEGEYLSPLDLCQEEGILHDLLVDNNALLGTAISRPAHSGTSSTVLTPHDTEPAKEADQKPEDETDGKVPATLESPTISREDPMSVPSLQRPPTPSRLSLSKVPGFTKDQLERPSSSQPVRPPTPATPPPPSPDLRRQGTGMLKKAFQLMRKRKKKAGPDEGDGPALASAVGFFASQATMLVAAVVGTYLGDKARKVAEKVALGTAKELKKAAAEHEGEVEDLVWPIEEVDAPATPPATHPPPTPPSPTPTPRTPVEEEDPMDRRLRKARAQLDMRKSAGLLALEELVKAQETQTKLNRHFHEDRMKDAIRRRREEFQAAEAREIALADEDRRKLLDRVDKAENQSEMVKNQIEEDLSKASRENDAVAVMMGEMGVNPRPTVAQWLKRKNMQKKAEMQESLISWDRDRKRREAAILVEQTILTHRATKHAAWGAKKDLSSQIRALKTSPYKDRIGKPAMFTPSSYPVEKRTKSPRESSGKVRGSRRIFPVPSSRGRTSNKVAPMVETQVMPTPGGFRKVITKVTPGERRVQPEEDQTDLWSKGQTYAASGKLNLSVPFTATPTYQRAIGPKTIHAERTLHFVSPQEYKAVKAADKVHMKKLSQQFKNSEASEDGKGSQSTRKSTIVIRSMDFQQEKITRRMSHDRSASLSSAQYHSLSGSTSKGRGHQNGSTHHNVAAPILKMDIVSTPREHAQVASNS